MTAPLSSRPEREADAGATCAGCGEFLVCESCSGAGETPSPESLRELGEWFDAKSPPTLFARVGTAHAEWTPGYLLRRIADAYEAALRTSEPGGSQ